MSLNAKFKTEEDVRKQSNQWRINELVTASTLWQVSHGFRSVDIWLMDSSEPRIHKTIPHVYVDMTNVSVKFCQESFHLWATPIHKKDKYVEEMLSWWKFTCSYYQSVHVEKNTRLLYFTNMFWERTKNGLTWARTPFWVSSSFAHIFINSPS